MNTGETDAKVEAGQFAERTSGFGAAVDVITGRRYLLRDGVVVPAGQMLVLELQR